MSSLVYNVLLVQAAVRAPTVFVFCATTNLGGKLSMRVSVGLFPETLAVGPALNNVNMRKDRGDVARRRRTQNKRQLRVQSPMLSN